MLAQVGTSLFGSSFLFGSNRLHWALPRLPASTMLLVGIGSKMCRVLLRLDSCLYAHMEGAS